MPKVSVDGADNSRCAISTTCGPTRCDPSSRYRGYGDADRLTDAFYWASSDGSSATSDITLLDEVGGCFETVAEGLLLVRDAQHRRGGLER